MVFEWRVNGEFVLAIELYFGIYGNVWLYLGRDWVGIFGWILVVDFEVAISKGDYLLIVGSFEVEGVF